MTFKYISKIKKKKQQILNNGTIEEKKGNSILGNKLAYK